MAINTLDDVVAALSAANRQDLYSQKLGPATVAGVPYFLGVSGGFPAALAVPGNIAANGTIYTNASTNALPIVNPTVAHYLAKLNISSSQIITNRLVDLIWGVTWVATVTGAQAITFPTVPNRDVNGSNTGLGVRMYFCAWATIGASAGTVTVTYTNSDGVAGRTAVITPVTASAIGRCLEFTLQAGDKGVRSVQSVNASATMTSGTPTILLVRNITDVQNKIANVTETSDWAQTGLAKLYSGTCLTNMVIPTTTTAPNIDALYTIIDK